MKNNLTEKINLILTTTFGLEAVVKREVLDLGYTDIKVSDGKVEVLNCEYKDIAKLNINIRCAERVLLKVLEKQVTSFSELFDIVNEFSWEKYIEEDDIFPVDAVSINSKLFSRSDIQSITKKAIVKRLSKAYGIEYFKEEKNLYNVKVSILKDLATITIDTSGEGLHKRGYRDRAGDAPLKETLAAAMVKLSFWNKDRLLFLHCCKGQLKAIFLHQLWRSNAFLRQKIFFGLAYRHAQQLKALDSNSL